jgi:hypothetical protein
MCGCVGIEETIGAAMGDGTTSIGLSITDGLGGAAGMGGADVIEAAMEEGGGWGMPGMGVSDGVGDGVGVGVGVRTGIRVGAGARIAGSGMGGCD